MAHLHPPRRRGPGPTVSRGPTGVPWPSCAPPGWPRAAQRARRRPCWTRAVPPRSARRVQDRPLGMHGMKAECAGLGVGGRGPWDPGCTGGAPRIGCSVSAGIACCTNHPAHSIKPCTRTWAVGFVGVVGGQGLQGQPPRAAVYRCRGLLAAPLRCAPWQDGQEKGWGLLLCRLDTWRLSASLGRHRPKQKDALHWRGQPRILSSNSSMHAPPSWGGRSWQWV